MPKKSHITLTPHKHFPWSVLTMTCKYYLREHLMMSESRLHTDVRATMPFAPLGYFLLGIILEYEISGVWNQNEQHVFLTEVQSNPTTRRTAPMTSPFLASLECSKLCCQPLRPVPPGKAWCVAWDGSAVCAQKVLQINHPKALQACFESYVVSCTCWFFHKKKWLLGSRGWEGSSQGNVSFLN